MLDENSLDVRDAMRALGWMEVWCHPTKGPQIMVTGVELDMNAGNLLAMLKAKEQCEAALELCRKEDEEAGE